MENYLATIWLLLALVALGKLWEAVLVLLWRPFAIARKMKKQGVTGPPRKLVEGNLEEIRRMTAEGRNIIMDVSSHEYTPRILPHYLKWSSQYGEMFIYWVGTCPKICIMDIELVKQILSNTSGLYVKENMKAPALSLLGLGIVFREGSDWVRHRKLINPAFAMDKLKGMTHGMALCVISMLDKWQQHALNSGDSSGSVQLEVKADLSELVGNVLCRSAFGNSFKEGKEVFKAQDELRYMVASSFLNIEIPIYRYLPVKENRRRWALEKKIKTTLTKLIKDRMNDTKGMKYGSDLLGLLVKAYRDDDHPSKNNDVTLDMNEIIDECKTFFFAGHETTANLLAWTMYILALNQDWQERVREEVLNELGTAIPDGDNITKLKLVTMVLLEVVRLYCPVVRVGRATTKDVRLGGVEIPKGSQVTIPLAILHRSKGLWGSDAGEFNPLRFKDGISKAGSHPNALISFSFGPRSCIGQNFAMLESKIAIAMILQRFRFTLSEEYKHAPIDRLTLYPQYGLQLILKPLKN